jgi:hypothetical protein
MREEQRLVAAKVERPDQVAAILVRLDHRGVIGDHRFAQLVLVFGNAIQHEAAHAGGIAGGKLAGDAGAGVSAVRIDRPEAQRVAEAVHGIREIGDVGLGRPRGGGIAVAERIRRDDLAKESRRAKGRHQVLHEP